MEPGGGPPLLTSCSWWGAGALLPGAVSQPSSTTARMAAANPMSPPRTVLTLVKVFAHAANLLPRRPANSEVTEAVTAVLPAMG